MRYVEFKNYKKGKAGQLKGKDAFKKKSKPGGNETPHPARGKLVGESLKRRRQLRHRAAQTWNKGCGRSVRHPSASPTVHRGGDPLALPAANLSADQGTVCSSTRGGGAAVDYCDGRAAAAISDHAMAWGNTQRLNKVDKYYISNKKMCM